MLARWEGKFLTSKYTSLRYHYLMEKVSSREIELSYVQTGEQLTDILKNPLVGPGFEELINKLVKGQADGS